MKKYILLALLVFCIGLMNASAFEMSTSECFYRENASHNMSGGRSWKNYLHVAYMGLGESLGMPRLGTLRYFSLDSDQEQAFLSDENARIDDYVDDYIFYYDDTEADQYYMNWNIPINGIKAPYLYTTEGVISQKLDEAIAADSSELICPSTIYIFKYTDSSWFGGEETRYELYACGNNYGDYNKDTCPATQSYLQAQKSKYDNASIITTNYFAETFVTNAGQDDPSDTNVADQWAENAANIDVVCADEYKAEHGDEECLKAKMEQDGYEGQAEDQGVTESELISAYEEYKAYQEALDYDFSTGECESYLGNVYTKGTPAYMLNFAFNIMKYAAIVLLFVFTVVELAKSVADGKDETRKKATQNIIKRLIIAVVIFFLPLLINFILSLLGVVNMSEACAVGSAEVNTSSVGEEE